MNKAVKVLSVVVVLTFIVVAGRSCYQVLCISCTPGPVKTYNYPGSMDELENHFKRFALANPDIDCKISHRGTDSMAARENLPADFITKAARDVIIKQKIKAKDIECHLVIYDFNGSTKLDIDEIFDPNHNNVGQNADDKNVKELLAEFENSFLTRFTKDQKIEFKRKLFNF